MKKFSKYISLLALALVIPQLAFAFTCTAQPGTIGAIICTVVGILNILMPALVLFATVYFIYGVVKYMTASEPEAQGEARSMMIHGIIALFVILSLWGLVRVLQKTFGLGGQNQIQQNDLPQLL